MEILVTGATGAVGTVLVPALLAAGHDVRAATRRPAAYDGVGRAVELDLDRDVSAAPGVVDGADAAYYLVHALDRPDMAEAERARAERFAALWGDRGPVVYLGGLGPDAPGSAHLRTRHEVGEVLRRRCRTVELRASIVIGAESLSFLLACRTARLLARVPVPVVVPSAARVRTQPIAEQDLVAALVAALGHDPGVYEIGGDEVVTFADIVARTARAQGRRARALPCIPLGADWFGPAAALVTRTDPWATTALLASMATETVIDDARRPPGADGSGTPLDEALARAVDAAGC